MFRFFLVPIPSSELFIGRKLEACVSEEYAAVPVSFHRCNLRDEGRLRELCALRLMHCVKLRVKKHRLLLVYPLKWKTQQFCLLDF